ncbi:MAG: hypothetical protein HOP33_12235, partial [Verrucomicrobia bacterium]|nr:hypothetical protein [Verrucomicrobiota bacterium]
MNRIFISNIGNLAFIGLALCSKINSHAALIAYEGFDYPAGTTIATQTGGTGWTNSWTAGSAGNHMGTNSAVSLNYTDANSNALQTIGGSVIVGNPVATTTTTATPNRLMDYNLSGGAGVAVGPGATTWISFLYKRLNFDLGTLPFSRQSTVSLFEGSGERVPIGSPNTTATVSNVFSVWGTGAHNVNAPFQSPDYPVTSGSTYFVLMKVVTDGTAAVDAAYIWVNWTNLTMEPGNATATFVQNEVNLSSINTLRLQANNQNANGSNAVFQVDEIRIGTTFPDVAPQAAAPSTPPSITSEPANLSVVVGDPATFTVNADGTAPLRYQWYFNTNTPLADATNATLTILNAQSNNIGGYSVTITNSAGLTNSVVAMLTVLPPVAPGITAQPQNFTNVAGFNATFSVTATGSAPLRYQWYFNNNTPLPMLTNTTATFPITSTNDGGNYSVIVTNSAGSVTSTVASLVVVPGSPAGLPAFPGADGAAKFVTGGRGGIVYHVTKLDRNMNHNEAGTLRYGLTDGNFPPGVPRTIVFDVAGTFWLGRFGAESNHMHGWDAASRYNLSGNTTIAGQTAPGPVIIAGGVTKASSANTIARNLMFAPSYGMRSFEDPPTLPTPGDFPDSFVFDALDISGQNIMLDHLTAIYATDETISANELANNLTIQFCTMAQGENYPQADAENPGVYGGHALGSLLQAGSNAKVSVINNFYAHLKGRLPRVGSEVGTGALNDFRNNVFYNWFNTAGTGAGGQPSFNNFINNFHLAGDGGDDVSGTNIVSAGGGTSIFSGDGGPVTRAYVSGNLKDTNKDADPNDTSSADGNYSSILPQATAYDINIGVTLSPQATLTNALRYGGSRWWERDYDIALGNTGAINTVDERLAHEAITGTGQIIAWADDPFNSSPGEGLEWKGLLALRADTNTFAAPFNHPAGWDTDGDGLPNSWEALHGLNPSVPNNNADFDSDGYTDLEEYLNELAAWPAPGVITFTGNANSRYASIFNWQVIGVSVNIAGTNTTTSSPWQPSRYDAAIIHSQTVVVDSAGQHAGYLRVEAGGLLNITNGWLSIANRLESSADSAICVLSPAGLRVTNNFANSGTLLLSGNASLHVGGTFTNTGTLDIMTWNGTLPGGFVNLGTVLDRNLIVMTSFGVSGTNFTATIQGYVGHNYQLQYRDGVANWRVAKRWITRYRRGRTHHFDTHRQ